MRKYLIVIVGILTAFAGQAQIQSTVYQGEFGLTAGGSHYFGDLNTDGHLNRPKVALGVFYRKQFNNYIALRVSAHYAQLGYSDVYNVKNQFQLRRNLSFNTNIWEFALQGDFNFFRFQPGTLDYAFTPYVTFGVGAFSYDPFAYSKGEKIYLRPLGTEGQGNPGYGKTYSPMALCIPFGVGVKYNINEKVNIGFEVVYRFTGTDYIDDVSKKYVDPAILKSENAIIMSDRSNETGDEKIGFTNGVSRQRGLPKQKDAYVMAEIMFSFNLSSYRCPKAD